MVRTNQRKRARYGFYSCCQDLVKKFHSHFSSEKRRNRLEPSLQRVKDRLITATGLSRASITRLLSDAEYPEPGESITRVRPRKLTEEEIARIRPAFSAGTKDGWLPNSFKMWKGNTKSEDYHTEMNSDVLNDWLVNFCLPNMNRDGVLVMDRAPYHVACSEDTLPPQSNWKKEDLAAYILRHDTNNMYTEHMLLHQEHEIQFLRNGEDGRRRVRTRKGFLRTMLLSIAKDMAPPKVMRVTKTLNQWNIDHNTDIKILLLPIAHPQLNPIELVWSWVKTEVAKRNKDFKMKTLYDLTIQRKDEITPEMWSKSCRRSDEIAREYMEVDEEVLDEGDDDNDNNDNNEGAEESNEDLSDS